jgi:predicted dienelactone hydrolase
MKKASATMLSAGLRLAGWLGLAWAILLAGVVCAQSASGVGFQAITIHDPVNGDSMPGYVFYPSAAPDAVTWVGPYELHATANATPTAGAKPLVVISHGHSGSNLGHHDLAIYLAGHGFVVATLQHPRDNHIDDSGDGHPEVMIGRPIQVQATISMLLRDPRWKTLVDPERIGVAGFSNGGYTSLLLVGAVPKFVRFITYCEKHADDLGICGHVKQVTAALAKQGSTPRQSLAAMQGEIHRWGDMDDPRIKAAFAMAPQSLVFDKAGLASINRPVFLYYGQDDEVLRPKYNVLHAAPLISTLAGVKMIPKAGHYVFLAPCSRELAKEAAEICRDPPGVDRAKVHAQVNADALDFFRRTLVPSSH